MLYSAVMRHYKFGAYSKTDLKIHLVWIPKYRKKVLLGDIAVSSGNITDEMIQSYIDEQEGEQIANDSEFRID